jgi:hypothetical protein
MRILWLRVFNENSGSMFDGNQQRCPKFDVGGGLMALYLLKPVMWNDQGYRGPAGCKTAKKSFPGENGWGQEEWNNDDRLEFSEKGQDFRVFYTTPIKNAPVDEHPGRIFVLMIASHDGVQQLVGVAGNAIYLAQEKWTRERQRLVKLLGLKRLGADAWRAQSVQRAFKQQRKFEAAWNHELDTLPSWLCEAGLFWWPQQPVTLDAPGITGKQKLTSMFSAYQAIEANIAEQIMASVTHSQRDEAWQRVAYAMHVAPGLPPPEISLKGRVRPTTYMTQIQARIGQGWFRDKLFNRWSGCSVTGLKNESVLRASHVKRWCDSNDTERLDVDNGLLLTANLDSLFEAALISFEDDGAMLIAPELTKDECFQMRLGSPLLQVPTLGLRRYLKSHRERFKERVRIKT